SGKFFSCIAKILRILEMSLHGSQRRDLKTKRRRVARGPGTRRQWLSGATAALPRFMNVRVKGGRFRSCIADRNRVLAQKITDCAARDWIDTKRGVFARGGNGWADGGQRVNRHSNCWNNVGITAHTAII